MSAEKIFCEWSSEFQFAFAVLFGFLYSVLGSVFSVFGCAWMLFSVKFHVDMRGV